MKFKNLTEDEEEARKERRAVNTGVILLFAGVILIYMAVKNMK